jgi:hypothetical protein
MRGSKPEPYPGVVNARVVVWAYPRSLLKIEYLLARGEAGAIASVILLFSENLKPL